MNVCKGCGHNVDDHSNEHGVEIGQGCTNMDNGDYCLCALSAVEAFSLSAPLPSGTVTFTLANYEGDSSEGNYSCDLSGNQTGEYVPVATARALVDATRPLIEKLYESFGEHKPQYLPDMEIFCGDPAITVEEIRLARAALTQFEGGQQ